MTCGRLSVKNALLERLAQDFQDVACALGQFVQKEHAVVRQRHLPGHRHLPAANQPDIREGVVTDAKGVRGDQGGGPPGGAAPPGGSTTR
jgi:hypothetical protein